MPITPPNPQFISLPTGSLQQNLDWQYDSIQEYHSKELVKLLQPNIPILVLDAMIEELQQKITQTMSMAAATAKQQQPQCSGTQTQE